MKRPPEFIEKKANTVCLVVRIHRGGEYWRECLRSIKPLFDAGERLFHEIIFSFSKNDLQEEDRRSAVEILGLNEFNLKTMHLSLLSQSEILSPVAHHVAVMSHEIQSEFVFHLCHDDKLLIEGVRQMLGLLNEMGTESLAIMGPFEWSETRETIGGITRQLIEHPTGLPRETFIERDLIRPFYISLSGICSSVSSFRNYLHFYSSFERGFRFDHLLITGPGIRRVIQAEGPTVWIRLHEESDGSQRTSGDLLRETLTYFFIQWCTVKNWRLKARLARRIYSTAKASPIAAFLRLFELMKGLYG